MSKQESTGSLLAPVRPMIAAGVVVQVLGSVAELVPFIAIVELTRELLGDTSPDAGRLWWIVGIAAAGLGARAAASGAAILITHFADVRLQAHLRRSIVARLGRVPLGWFDHRSSGVVRKAAHEDVARLHYLVAHNAVETTAAVTAPVVGLGYLLWLDWRLALVALIPVLIYGAAMSITMRDVGTQMRAMNEGLERISTTTVELVRGLAVVKAFGRDGQASAPYRQATGDFAVFFRGWLGPMVRIEAISSMALTPAFVLLVNLGFGLWFVGAGWVNGIDVLAATLIAFVLPSALLTLNGGLQARIEARDASGHLSDLLATRPLPEPRQTRSPQGQAVEFEQVSFSYPGGPQAVREVSLRLEPGTITALVGASGSGKSTLAALALRFHDVDNGAIRIGGVDVRDMEASDLYSRIGFVLQDVQLLHATIAENIALACPETSEADIHHVARQAQIHDRIMSLPRGYDSVVGDDALLSGGQAQRVSIARALLHAPPILVLDEATAFADPDTEAEVQAALAELIRDRTVLVIAHRLHTIVAADRIVVLDGGRIAEQGSHDELVAADGAYAQMWRWADEGAA